MSRKKQKCYMADFETTTDLHDCRVWAWGLSEIGNPAFYIEGNSIEEFFNSIENLGTCTIYFHNLAFDGTFILNYILLKNYKHVEDKKYMQKETFTTLITDSGIFYMIKIKMEKDITITFYDSLKKIPQPVKKIAKNFGLEESKGEIDYRANRGLDYTPTEEEREYVKNDVIIVTKALHTLLEEGLDKMTIASDSLNSFKSTTDFKKLFPIQTEEKDAFFRRAYRGGFTYVNPRFQNVDLGNMEVYDVNSLYPSVMYDKPYPYDDPIYFEGEYKDTPDYPLFIQRMIVDFKLKQNHIPMIQIKNNPFYKGTEYLTDSEGEVELTLTSVDLQLFKDMYEIRSIRYLDGYAFKSISGLFKEYIDKWTKVKEENTKTEDNPNVNEALRTIAKLMLNSLYGKFATRTHHISKIPYLKDDGSVGYARSEESIEDSIYTPVACFVTAYAREKTIRSAFKVFDRWCYADTDSLHLLAHPDNIKILDVHPTHLGYWKQESLPTRARFLRAKTYIEEIKGKLEVKCAGMPDNVKEEVTWDNFHYGFTSEHKLKPVRVKGGIVLVDTPFTIK